MSRQETYRGNLSAAKFPLVAHLMGQTVIIPKYDNVYVPVIASKTDDDKDRGIPQIYYCHNVMPTDQGFQSIGYETRILPYIGVVFDRINEIRSGLNKAYLSYDLTTGNNWIFLNVAPYIWIPTTLVASGSIISTAYINGETYIYYSNVGCYKYDFGLNVLTAVVLGGLVAADIVGITSAAGYLIAWTTSAVAWSSTIDPTDFVPSLVTGAGGGAVELARGPINICAPHSLGFILYTDNNAVGAIYSGNARFPFNFKEINGSGGCSTLELVSWQSNTSSHYAYTTSGLQTIGLSSCQTILPEIIDFLAGKHFEDFNEITLEFEETTLAATMVKKLSVVSDRYLVLSYGIATLTHALIYDLVTRRLGKVRIAHVDCFEWAFSSPERTESPRDCIAFLRPDGSVSTINFNPDLITSFGVLVLGKYQLIRNRNLNLHSVETENIPVGAQFTLYDMPAMDGKNFDSKVAGYLQENSGLYRKYLFDTVGKNHALLYLGTFNLVSYTLTFSSHGK